MENVAVKNHTKRIVGIVMERVIIWDMLATGLND